MNNRALGKTGEDAAAEYLCSKGYSIAERNYRTRQGECDIIAYDGEVLVFAEVKTRCSDRLGLPCEAVTRKKQRNISQVALVYLQEKGLGETNVRFDVVEIRIDGAGSRIRHITSAFEYLPVD